MPFLGLTRHGEVSYPDLFICSSQSDTSLGYALFQGNAAVGVALINPHMTVAQATTSLQPLISFFASLPPASIVIGANAVAQTPSYYPFWENAISPISGVGPM